MPRPSSLWITLTALSLVPGCYDSLPPDEGDAGRPTRMDAAVPECVRGDDPTPGVSPHTIDGCALAEHRQVPMAGGLHLLGSPQFYHLSNETSWESGPSQGREGAAQLVRVERAGTSLLYHLMAPSPLLTHSENGDDHKANFALEAIAPLVLEAGEGDRVGVVRGEVRILFDEPASAGVAGFHHLSAPRCSIVPFVATYTLDEPARFTETLFDAPFGYVVESTIDFTSPRF